MKGIAAVSCGSGGIDIFNLQRQFEAASLSVAHRHWDEGAWSGAEDLGGALSTVPAAVSSRARPPRPLPPHNPPVSASEEIIILPCRIDVFAVDEQFAMRQQTLWRSVASEPPEWASLGGVFTSAPAAINWEGERIDLFGLGTDYAMYRKVWNGLDWTGDWERLGGTFSSAASVVKMQSDQIDVFVRGADYTLRHRAFTIAGPVTGWQNLGGSLASPPAAVSWGENRMDVFGAGHDGALWHRWWDGQIWNDWESLGGVIGSEPSAVSWGEGRIDVLATGLDAAIYQYTFADETWSGPTNIGGTMTSAPTAFTLGPDNIHAMSPGTDALIHTAEFDGAAWDFPFTNVLGGHISLPSRYRFSVDYVTAGTTRSLNNDTDSSQATIAPGNWSSQTALQSIGDIGGADPSQAQTNLLNFEPITVEMCEPATFNYVIVNNGHADQVSLDTALSGLGQAIASKVVEVVSGVSIVGAAAGLIIGELGSFLFQDCDGLVAAENIAFNGRDLYIKTGTGGYDSVVVTHDGTDSPTGCGANSVYEVTWSVVRA